MNANDEKMVQFQSLTGADMAKALQYMELCDNNIERAIDLFYSTGGADLLSDTSAAASAPSRPAPSGGGPEIVNLDSDEEGGSRPPQSSTVEDDEAMARRLQEEMYGGGGSSAGASGGVDAEGYRAPIARTIETLVGGPGMEDYNMEDPADRESAILSQLRAREQARLARSELF